MELTSSSNSSQVLSVAEFINYINQALRPFSKATIEGEVTDFSKTRKKWVSFDLKDEEDEQILSCFTSYGIYKKRGLEGVLEEGMRVHIKGDVKIRQRGNLSLFAKSIKLAGEGTLKIAYEKLKAKLKKEGLFSKKRKRSLPSYPQKIGIVTSGDARALSDFKKVLKARMGGLELYHTNVHVQGENAVPEILGAFDYLNNNQDRFGLDLIVLTRGGGSLEDLQAFNSEKVARAVFSSKAPVVCGVGHEEDITLAGLTADLRASTPSNAAELVVRDRREVLSEVRNLVEKIETGLSSRLEAQEERPDRFYRAAFGFLRQRKKSLQAIEGQFKREFVLFRKRIQEKKEKIDRFYRTSFSFIKKRRENLEVLKRRLSRELEAFGNRIEERKEEVNRIRKHILSGMREVYSGVKKFVFHQKRLLASYSPRAVLKRGYGIVRKEGKIIKDTQKLDKEDDLKISLHKGTFKALVKDIFSS